MNSSPSAAPSFLNQARLEKLLREVYRRAHVDVHGLEPAPEQLRATVQREIPALRDCFGEDLLTRLSEPLLRQPAQPEDVPADTSFTYAWLTREQRQEAESALWYAKLHGIDSIVAVLEWHRVCNRAALEAPPIRTCIDRFVIAKRSERLTPMTVRNYAVRLERFARTFGDRRPASVTGPELNAYLEAWPQPTTRASHWRTLSVFFTWLFRRRYILRHPFGEGARPPARKTSARLIYTPEEAEEILRLSLERDTVGYWALTLFAGLRDCELKGIQARADPWAVVDWKEGAIDLRDARFISATNRRRVILVPCALAWLTWMRERNLPFYPRNSWEKVGRMRTRIMAARDFGPGQEPVTKNGRQLGDNLVYSIGRRSYLSYRLALEDSGPTGSAIVADHVGLTERLIKADYSGKASREEAERYFALTPTTFLSRPSLPSTA